MKPATLTNLITFLFIVCSFFIPQSLIKEYVLAIGLFGFSGSVTNWLAVHMLFEKVPGLYGSGIFLVKFEAFKTAIFNLIINEFFNKQNIERFISNFESEIDLPKLLDKVNLDTLFDGLLEAVEQSSFGSMLSFVGGIKALEALREPFKVKVKEKVSDMASTIDISQAEDPDMVDHFQDKVTSIISTRLDEMTPEMVKNLIRDLIKSHLGWLVVWGGVFGSLIGALAVTVRHYLG